MPTRHGASLAKNASTCLRLSLRATTTLPTASTPWTWNTFFARSIPMVVIAVMDGPFNGDSSSTITLRHLYVRRRPPHQLGQVAIYCRVSTDDQSCERQERDLRAFAKRAGHKVIAVFKETASGADNGRPERAKVLALARARKIDAVLVTELSRWGRSTQDLVQTLNDLHGWKVSVLAQTGLSFDLSTASGKLMRTIMAGLAEFERDLIRDRVKSGLAAARARGVKLGRQVGQRPSDKKAKRVLGMHADGLSYRLIARIVGLSKNTVMDIVRRNNGEP